MDPERYLDSYESVRAFSRVIEVYLYFDNLSCNRKKPEMAPQLQADYDQGRPYLLYHPRSCAA